MNESERWPEVPVCGAVEKNERKMKMPSEDEMDREKG